MNECGAVCFCPPENWESELEDGAKKLALASREALAVTDPTKSYDEYSPPPHPHTPHSYTKTDVLYANVASCTPK